MLLFPNGLCIKKSYHINLYCSRDTKVLYMLCITTKCMKSQQNLFKERYKKAPSIRAQRRSSKKNKILIYLF